MLGKIASASAKIFKTFSMKLEPGKALLQKNISSWIGSGLQNGHRLKPGQQLVKINAKSGVLNVYPTGQRYVSCKKVKERKKSNKKNKKGQSKDACVEVPCRCKMPCELDKPTRIRMDKGAKEKTIPSKEDIRKKKCRDGDCDFMDENGS